MATATLFDLKLFEARSGNTISTTPEIDAAIRAGAVVAFGVSGGKDSAAMALSASDWLDTHGHTGPRVLIHSDLGSIEWRDSLPECERLAARLGLDLITVRRAKGGLVDRWRSRWAANVRRYANLECVKLILPWSTPGMRFCTSELKTAIICRALAQRFPGQCIISASGIRRQESDERKKSKIAQIQSALCRKTLDTNGFDWHPIIEWSTDEVYEYLDSTGFGLHPAYRVYGSSRVSCVCCIMSRIDDLHAAMRCADNHDVYRDLVELEAESTFSFQSRWLADVAPSLLSPELRHRIAAAKENAQSREAAEKRIPKHLLYAKGWPTCIPTPAEAELLCDVRRTVAAALGIAVQYTEPAALIARYRELMTHNESR